MWKLCVLHQFKVLCRQKYDIMAAYKWTKTVFIAVKRGKSGGRNESQYDKQNEYAELKKTMIHKENGNLTLI